LQPLSSMASDLKGSRLRKKILDRLLGKLLIFKLSDLSGNIQSSLNTSVGVFCSQYNKNLVTVNDNLTEFMLKESKWLDSQIYLDDVANQFFIDNESVEEFQVNTHYLNR